VRRWTATIYDRRDNDGDVLIRCAEQLFGLRECRTSSTEETAR
jgi:hypothetical protein